jgi:RES domain-containing protein
MLVYRITKKEHSALDGSGGLLAPGRWHKKGNLVIYTSEHASLAAWEKIVHVTSLKNLPENLVLVRIEIPEFVEIQSIPQDVLVRDWNGFPYIPETMEYGSSFLKEKKHLAIRVPSVIIPDEYNILLNPLHPDIFHCKIIDTIPFAFDYRLFKSFV